MNDKQSNEDRASAQEFLAALLGFGKDIAEAGADIVSDTAEDADVAAAGQLDKVIEWMDDHGVKRHVPQEPVLKRWARRLGRRS